MLFLSECVCVYVYMNVSVCTNLYLPGYSYEHIPETPMNSCQYHCLQAAGSQNLYEVKKHHR